MAFYRGQQGSVKFDDAGSSAAAITSTRSWSMTVDKATLVRVYNDAGAVNVISVTDPTGVNAYSGVGSCTLAAGADIIIEKPADYTIWGKGQFAAAKVGFTN